MMMEANKAQRCWQSAKLGARSAASARLEPTS